MVTIILKKFTLAKCHQIIILRHYFKHELILKLVLVRILKNVCSIDQFEIVYTRGHITHPRSSNLLDVGTNVIDKNLL